MRAEAGHGHGRAGPGSGADHEADLGLQVEPLRRAEDRVAAGVAVLPAGTADRGPGDHDRAGAPVVADRQVPPVRGDAVRARAEDPRRVGGVMLVGVEVRVVGHGERQPEGEVGHRPQQRLGGGPVGGIGQPRPDRRADLGPGRRAGREQAVQRAGGEQRGQVGLDRGGRPGQVQRAVADPHDGKRPAPSVGRRPVGQVLGRERIVLRHAGPARHPVGLRMIAISVTTPSFGIMCITRGWPTSRRSRRRRWPCRPRRVPAAGTCRP